MLIARNVITKQNVPIIVPGIEIGVPLSEREILKTLIRLKITQKMPSDCSSGLLPEIILRGSGCKEIIKSIRPLSPNLNNFHNVVSDDGNSIFLDLLYLNGKIC